LHFGLHKLVGQCTLRIWPGNKSVTSWRVPAVSCRFPNYITTQQAMGETGVRPNGFGENLLQGRCWLVADLLPTCRLCCGFLMDLLSKQWESLQLVTDMLRENGAMDFGLGTL